MELDSHIVRSAKRRRKKVKINYGKIIRIVFATALILFAVEFVYVVIFGLAPIPAGKSVDDIYMSDSTVYLLTTDNTLYVNGKYDTADKHCYGFFTPLHNFIYNHAFFQKRKPVNVAYHVSAVSSDLYGTLVVTDSNAVNISTSYVEGYSFMTDLPIVATSAAMYNDEVYFVAPTGALCSFDLRTKRSTVVVEEGFVSVKSAAAGLFAALTDDGRLCVFPPHGQYDDFMACVRATDVINYSVFGSDIAYTDANGNAFYVSNVLSKLAQKTLVHKDAAEIEIGFEKSVCIYVLTKTNDVLYSAGNTKNELLYSFGDEPVKRIAAGKDTVVILAGNSLYAWGNNSSGQYGLRRAKSVALSSDAWCHIDLGTFSGEDCVRPTPAPSITPAGTDITGS